MTLIITVGTGNEVVQASDRRMTWSAGRFDDTANKATCIECSDALVVVAYTGIGRLGFPAKPTDAWLLDALSDAPTKPLGDAAADLAQRAGAAIQVNPTNFKGEELTFVGAGFTGYDRTVVLKSSNLLDENGEPDSTPRNTFANCIRVSQGGRFLSLHGREDIAAAVQDRLWARLRDGTLSQLGGTAVADLLIEAIREIASHGYARGDVGSDCMSIVLQKGKTTALARYHPERGDAPIIYMPNLIAANACFGAPAARPPGWTSSPSAAVPFDRWTVLPLQVALTNQATLLRVHNRGSDGLTDVTFVIHAKPCDLHNLAEGLFFAPGHVMRVERLDALQERQLPVDAFRTMTDQYSLDPYEALNTGHLTVAARLSTGEFGRFGSAVKDLSV